MIIFWLDEDYEKSARSYKDSHVHKIILEAAQAFSTAMYEMGYESDTIYGPYQENHPLSNWMKESFGNVIHSVNQAFYLNKEYKYRYGNGDHSSWEMFSDVSWNDVEQLFDSYHVTDPEFPSEADSDNVITGYRMYYLMNKIDENVTWKNRETPEWIKKNDIDSGGEFPLNQEVEFECNI